MGFAGRMAKSWFVAPLSLVMCQGRELSGMQTIGSVSTQYRGATSGFDYMRLLLATAVVAWHSYPISYGGEAAAQVWLSPLGSLIHLVLPMFFALSGFLVCSSLLRTQDIFQFLGFRVVRIFPALVVEVLISALILGPILTTVPLSQYFAGSEFYNYLKNLYGNVHFYLPGVFENNTVPGLVNMSLWTVPYELECYIAISVLFVVGFMGRRLFPIALAGISLLLIGQGILFGKVGFDDKWVNGRVLVVSFLAGAGVYLYRHSLPYSKAWALCALVLSVALASNPYAIFLAPLPLSYLTAYIGLTNPPRTVVLKGDFSYGIYLYAAPIQQTIALTLGEHNTWIVNFLGALVIAALIAIFSWFAIEKPFIRIKRFIPNLGLRFPSGLLQDKESRAS